jgi:hypothetical protein
MERRQFLSTGTIATTAILASQAPESAAEETRPSLYRTS